MSKKPSNSSFSRTQKPRLFDVQNQVGGILSIFHAVYKPQCTDQDSGTLLVAEYVAVPPNVKLHTIGNPFEEQIFVPKTLHAMRRSAMKMTMKFTCSLPGML
ncbi:hypothetical protein Fot_41368 [Forsythia ovata]|uniref:Uncharacterized protein n=1 Tax=Forsythia ovata TaxID=205694 RepID=A0ABD1RI23_9LAMI